MGSKTGLTITLIVIVLATAAYIYFDGNIPEIKDITLPAQKTEFTKGDVIQKYNFDSKATFYSNSSSDFFFVTKNGVKYISLNGNAKWDVAIDLKEPKLVGNGDFVAVGELGGNMIYVFGKNGEIYRKQFENNMIVQSFNINKSGYVSVILQDGEEYRTIVFDSTGFNIWEWKYQLPNIYPIATAVSGDSRILACALFNVSEYLSTNLMYAYLDKNEAKDFTDTIFYSKNKDELVVGALGFMGAGWHIAVSDGDVTGASFGSTNVITDEWGFEVNNKIDFFGLIGDRGFATVLGNSLINKQGEGVGTINFYDNKGQPVGTVDLGKKAMSFTSSKDGVIVSTGRTYYAFSPKGKPLWQYEATADVNQVIFLNNTDTILVATPTEAAVYKRK